MSNQLDSVEDAIRSAKRQRAEAIRRARQDVSVLTKDYAQLHRNYVSTMRELRANLVMAAELVDRVELKRKPAAAAIVDRIVKSLNDTRNSYDQQRDELEMLLEDAGFDAPLMMEQCELE